jgi:hypothetical protein
MPKPRRRTGRKRQAAITLPAVVTVIEIDNPLYNRAHDGDRTNPKRITAAYNPRESYVGFLHAKSIITDAEKMAGDRIRKAFEAMGGSGARAMDYSRVFVDGGNIPEPIGNAQLEAGRVLKFAAIALGPHGYELTLALAGMCKWPEEMAQTRRKREYIGQRFRECLETLAVHWGYQRQKTAA